MRIERTKNAKRNFIWGLINKILGLIVPFICRGAIIRIFGMNYLGLSSLFSSILTTLNLAELGFGSAIVFFMYKAIAEDNKEKICALMQFYKKVYRVIGIAILCMGLLIMPFLPYLIKKDIPTDINIYIVYLLTLAGTAVTYFLYAYKNSILVAFQRSDIASKVSSIILLGERILQLFCIIILHNYYFYLAVTILMNAVNNIVTAKYADKLYPEYNARGTLGKEEKKAIAKKITGLFWYKVGNMVLGSADTIVISAFLGLIVSGIYGNYYYVISTLFSFLAIYYSSFRAGLGNSIAVETVDKNYNDFKVLQLIQTWIISWCSICLLCLFQDFIILYAGKDNVLSFGLVVSICIYFFVWRIQDVVSVYKEASGLWDSDKYRPLIGALINLVLNIITVQYIGLYGVIYSTVVVLVFVDIPWASKVLFNEYFKVGRKEYFKLLIHAAVMLIIMAVPTYGICHLIPCENHLLSLVLRSLVCVIIPNLIFVLLNRKSSVFSAVMTKVKFMLHIHA